MEYSFTADESSSGQRADIFLSERAELSRSKIKRMMDDGSAIFENGTRVKPSYPLEDGDTIILNVPDSREPSFAPENIPLNIVYEDNHLLVVHKPRGMVVHPGRGNVTGTLASALLYHCKSLSTVGGKMRPGIVHRLDKDTSGLLVVALNDDVHLALSSMLERRDISRIYTAFVWGRPNPPEGEIDAPLGRHPKKPTIRAVVENGREAQTGYETVRTFDFLTKLSVRLRTGRTHQIRVHLAHIGHHVFGDHEYGGRDSRLKGFAPEIRSVARRFLKTVDRQALHAGRLEFVHPVTGNEMTFESPLPEDLASFESALIELDEK